VLATVAPQGLRRHEGGAPDPAPVHPDPWSDASSQHDCAQPAASAPHEERRAGARREVLDVLAAQLDTLVESAPQGIGLFDRQVRHVRVNPVLEDMNGLPRDQLLGRTPAELHGAVGRQAEALYRAVMESGVPSRDVLLTGEVSSRPGDQRDWSTSFFPVRHEGEVIGLCVIVDDVTEARRLHSALVESEERHRRLAEHLRRSMLTTLPRPAGLQLEAAYLPAARGHEVGGDWYDAFVLGDGATALVIGDVAGHDTTATATMGAVRNLLRGLAWDRGAPPSEVVRRVDEALRGLGVEAVTTLVYARVEEAAADDAPGTRRLSWTNAGHPPPLLLLPDGAVHVLQPPPELLLGVDARATRTDHAVVVPAGARLLLHTDGLVERRGEDLSRGTARLVEVLSGLARAPLDELLREVVDRLIGAGDDAAVLGVRLHP
jgi:PAS domain S-box-containing protein